jgi:hypothetical protein
VEHGGIRVGDAPIIPFPEAASISATRTDRTRVLGRNAVDLVRTSPRGRFKRIIPPSPLTFDCADV